jgi:NAD-dependent deacetylase
MRNKTIIVLTGAGISVESGLATFRDAGGLWCGHRIEDVATPEAFGRDPKRVHEFYNLRRAQLKDAAPNAAHLALAKLAARWQGRFFLITQNVDDLHERAQTLHPPAIGYQLFHMHGELNKARCQASEEIIDWRDDLTVATPCPCCGKPGSLRPHIVWFGEMPLHMEFFAKIFPECDLFMSIGTSGNVYPAAGFVREVRALSRSHTVELNLEPSLVNSLFAEKIYGPAGEIVPRYVERILAGEV